MRVANANAWEQRKLLDNIESIIDFRGRTPRKLGMDWSGSGYLALSALNVKNGYIDPNIDAHYGDENLYQKWMSGNELKKGQVLFTTEAPMGNVAQIPDNKKYILSQRTIAINIKKWLITDDFLAVLLRSPNVFNELDSLSSGGTAKGVSQKSLANLYVRVPISLEEQTAIGNFFKQLDDTIALHQRELDKLKILKEAYLKSIFVDNTTLFYSKYTTTWEQRKLGDVLKIKSGMSQKEIEEPNGKYPILATGGEIGRTNIAIYNRESVLIGRKGTIDKPYYMNTPFWTVDTLFYTELSSHIFGLFIYYLFQKIDWKNYDTSTGVPSLTSSTIHNIGVFIPRSLKEQTTIGNFFKQLDDTIALHQKELAKYQQIKVACLEKMFIK